MKIAFYGSSLVSSYWNGAATYYRGLLKALSQLGYRIAFLEPDAYDRQAHRDMAAPSWAESIVYSADQAGLDRALAVARQADVVVKASGVGVFDDELLAGIIKTASADAIRLFWDVDAAATLEALEAGTAPLLRASLPLLDGVMTYGGGDPVVARYKALGARHCLPVCNALDPDTHHPAEPDARFDADLAFLGNRLPDREARVDAFFLSVARALPERRFLLGGNGWPGADLPPNVRAIGHVGTMEHNAFNTTPLAVLNIARDAMARAGFSPATRVFEAAGAGACLITDAWDGIEAFLEPGKEILVAQDGADVARHLAALTPARAAAIGAAARQRVLRDHTYAQRAAEVDRALRALARHSRRAA